MIQEAFNAYQFKQSINWKLFYDIIAAKALKKHNPEQWEQVKKQLNNKGK